MILGLNPLWLLVIPVATGVILLFLILRKLRTKKAGNFAVFSFKDAVFFSPDHTTKRLLKISGGRMIWEEVTQIPPKPSAKEARLYLVPPIIEEGKVEDEQ